jgi:hypothetical protein
MTSTPYRPRSTKSPLKMYLLVRLGRPEISRMCSRSGSWPVLVSARQCYRQTVRHRSGRCTDSPCRSPTTVSVSPGSTVTYVVLRRWLSER